jgi:hypothetical protein
VGIATTGFCYPGGIRRVHHQLLHRPTGQIFFFLLFASLSDFFDNSIGRERPCSDLDYFDSSEARGPSSRTSQRSDLEDNTVNRANRKRQELHDRKFFWAKISDERQH